MTITINIKSIYILFSVLFVFSFLSCLTGGTHGSIKYYEYDVKKNTLQKAVNKVIASVPNIELAPITDTFNSRYYNDGDRYVTINIRVPGGVNSYIFQYAGDKEYWDTSQKSDLSIAYAHDKDGNGGSEGNGGISWYNWRLKKRLLEPFEKELIINLDKELKQKHVEGN